MIGGARLLVRLGAIGIGILIAACAGRVDRASIHEFQLVVVFAGPPRLTNGAGMPEEIVQLALPMENQQCPDVAFLPKLQALRLDLPDALPVLLTASAHQDWVARIQDFYAQHNLSRVRRDAELTARRQTFPTELLKAAAVDPPWTQQLSTYVASSSLRRIFVLEDTPAVWPASVDSAVVTVSKTPDDLIGKLSSSLCDDQRRNEMPTSMVVLYKPPAGLLGNRTSVRSAKTEQNEEASTTTARRNNNTADGATPGSEPQAGTESPPAVDDADRLFTTLRAKSQSVSEQDRRQLDDQLKRAETQFPHDYRFPYLRAGLAVYGREEHHQAFDLLFHAAEIAIVNHDTVAMLSDLAEDAHEGGRLHKLSHGHQEWLTLMNALRTGNVLLVRR